MYLKMDEELQAINEWLLKKGGSVFSRNYLLDR